MKELNYKRIGIYLLGLLILGCGIDLNTKTQLGVSPIISVAYNIAYLTHIPIGVMTFIYYVLLVIIQYSVRSLIIFNSYRFQPVLSQASLFRYLMELFLSLLAFQLVQPCLFLRL